VVTDPFAAEGGKKLPRNLTADIVTVSHHHPRHDNVAAVGGDPFVIDGPGEYETRDIFVTGVATFHDQAEGKVKGPNTIYHVIFDGLHLMHLGDLKHGLSGNHIPDVHSVDILFVPVGGGDTLSAKAASDLVDQLEPRIVIPMHYRSGKTGAGLDTVDAFLKARGMKQPDPVPILKVNKRDLPQDESQIVILEPQ